MTNITNLAPFNNFLPHCPFCGERPVISPCAHLKAFIFVEEPEEGESKIIYLSDDFRALLEDVMNTKFSFKIDVGGPPHRSLDSEYYFEENGGVESSGHLAELANAIEGAVCFQQSMGTNIIRSITFAINEEEHLKYDLYDRNMKAFKEEVEARDGSIIAKNINLDLNDNAFLDLEENDTLEFKQTFSLDTRQGNHSRRIREVLTKEVVGFLNTNPGQILIGIADKNGEILGIEQEGFQGDRDKYSLNISNFLKELCGVTAASLVTIDFMEVSSNKTICILTCKKSSEPVYCRIEGIEKPFVRYGSSTTEPSAREWLKFTKEYFLKKESV